MPIAWTERRCSENGPKRTPGMEASITETLARFGRHTRYVHLAAGEKRLEPGTLPFDYRPGFHQLKKWGYSGSLNIESKFTDTPAAGLARPVKYINEQRTEA